MRKTGKIQESRKTQDFRFAFNPVSNEALITPTSSGTSLSSLKGEFTVKKKTVILLLAAFAVLVALAVLVVVTALIITRSASAYGDASSWLNNDTFTFGTAIICESEA